MSTAAHLVSQIRARHHATAANQPTYLRLHAIADRAVANVRAIFRRAVAETKNATITAKLELLLLHHAKEAVLRAIPWAEIGAKILERRMGDRMTRLIVEAGTVAQRFQPDLGLRLGVRADEGGDLSGRNRRSTMDSCSSVILPALGSRPGPFSEGPSDSNQAEHETAVGSQSSREDSFVRFDDLTEALRPQEVNLTFDARNPFAIKAAIEESAKLVTKVSQETIDALAELIGDAIDRGIPPASAARMIRGMIGLNGPQMKSILKLADSGATANEIARATRQALNYRAEMIARTETIRAANLGQQALWKHGVEARIVDETARQEWIATPDDRECPVCAELDGKTFPLGGTIEAGKFGMVSGPPAHVQCRCSLALSFS